MAKREPVVIEGELQSLLELYDAGMHSDYALCVDGVSLESLLDGAPEQWRKDTRVVTDYGRVRIVIEWLDDKEVGG